MAKGSILSQQPLLAVMMVVALLSITTLISADSSNMTNISMDKFDQCANSTYACLTGEEGGYNSTVANCCCSFRWSDCKRQLNCDSGKEHWKGSEESCNYLKGMESMMKREEACPNGSIKFCLKSAVSPTTVSATSGAMMALAVLFTVFMQSY